MQLMEHLSRGVSMVTTPRPQAAAIVRAARAGLVVPYDDVGAAARAVEWLIHNGDDRRLLGSRGHAAARAHHDWRAHAERFVALLEDLPAGGTSWPSAPPRRG